MRRGADVVELAPISPRGAQLGVDYRYTMPHCGLHDQIDVDGSYWDPTAGSVIPNAYDGMPGTFRLVTHDEAVFTSVRPPLQLRRHDGPKSFPLCQ